MCNFGTPGGPQHAEAKADWWKPSGEEGHGTPGIVDVSKFPHHSELQSPSTARIADFGTSHPAERREVLLLLIISALELSLYLRI